MSDAMVKTKFKKLSFLKNVKSNCVRERKKKPVKSFTGLHKNPLKFNVCQENTSDI